MSKVKKIKSPKVELEENSEKIFLDFLNDEKNFNPPKKQVEKPNNPRKNNTNKKTSQKLTIDLHGLTLKQACEKINNIFTDLIHNNKPVQQIVDIKVITGKGLHSDEHGPVLPAGTHNYIRSNFAKYIIYIDDSPEKMKINGVSIRGHFTLKLRLR